MIVSLSEMKTYLRVDFSDDDTILTSMLNTAESLVADIIRVPRSILGDMTDVAIRTAIYYAVAYLYEHREEANHSELILTLRSLLFGLRKEGF